MRRILEATIASLLIGCALVACTPAARNLPTEAETAVPAALKEADLGVVEAWTELSVDGLARNLDVTFDLDQDSITAEDLRRVLEVVVEATGQDAEVGHLSLVAADANQPEDAGRDRLVDLQGPAQDLGFAESVSRGNAGIAIDWNEVTDFVQK